MEDVEWLWGVCKAGFAFWVILERFFGRDFRGDFGRFFWRFGLSV